MGLTKLNLYTTNKNLVALYKESIENWDSQNAGFDLFMPPQKKKTYYPSYYGVNHNELTDLEVAIALKSGDEFLGSYLFLRSSAPKHKIRLANSVGVIDPNYRNAEDTLKVALDWFNINEALNRHYLRLFQILPINGSKIQEVELVTELGHWENLVANAPPRGGFGSTGSGVWEILAN